MNFTNEQFWVFFIAIFILYWLVRSKRWQNIILLIASYVFYGWVQPWLAIMLGISTLTDFFLSKGIGQLHKYKRLFMGASLTLNLGVLAFFKYYNFFSSNLAKLAASQGVQSDIFLTSILLPAGLSFYTLKKLGYMIDVSRGTLKPTHTLVDFALYVSFFPQIAAGPIDRPQKLLPQIEAQRVWKADYFYSAWSLILMGLFKKIVIANSVSSLINRIFHLEQITLILAITGALGFTLQILADFSAYTDLSRGIAFLLGFETSENFKTPYLSLTPTDFWNRWHITLSTWLRDYIFFPTRRWFLRKQGQLPVWLAQATPALITMLICGLWHGAGWTYILWGGMYGILIAIYQAIGMGGNWKPVNKTKAFIAWLVMFSFIVFGWLLFAAPSLDWLIRIFSSPIVGSIEQQAVTLVGLMTVLIYSIPMIMHIILERYTKNDSIIRALYYAVITVMILVYTNSGTPDFIYFQF